MDKIGWLARARVLLVCLFAMCVAPAGLAQQAADSPPPLKPEELEALVAPIALYPDSLLSQVLMASTYPLEVVQADRWVKANPNVKGDDAVKAVASQSWDVSVKSLVAFPQVLDPMNDKLDWTQKLGDAFLDNQKAVLDAVQRLRQKAQQAGNLTTTSQQTVTVAPAQAAAGAPATQQTVIRIEPVNPQVVYVPMYNPTVVYGAWGWPAYPPYYWPPSPVYYPGYAFGAGFAWGVGVGAGMALFGGCDWGRGSVNVNVNRVTNIDNNFNRTRIDANGNWQHDPSHRKGVPYHDAATNQRFGRDASGADRRQDFRGRDGSGGAGDRSGPGDRSGAADRSGAGDRAGNRGADADGASNRSGLGDRSGSAASSGSRDHAFQGVGDASATQRNADRGRSSAASAGAGRSSFDRAGASRPSSGSFSGGARAGGGRGGRR